MKKKILVIAEDKNIFNKISEILNKKNFLTKEIDWARGSEVAVRKMLEIRYLYIIRVLFAQPQLERINQIFQRGERNCIVI